MLKTPALAILLLVTALPSFAQSTGPALASPTPYQHCILVSSGDQYSSSNVQLEYGQHAKLPVQDAKLGQDNQAVAKLGSIVFGKWIKVTTLARYSFLLDHHSIRSA